MERVKESKAEKPASNAADRIFKILECLGHYPSLNLDQVAQKTKVPVSTALRLLKTCVQSGYVNILDNKKYSLGSKIFILAHTHMQMHNPVASLARPHLEKLCFKTDESVHLGILSGKKVLYADKIDSPLLIRLNSYVGYQNDLHSTAMGKTLLAWMEPLARNELIKRLTLKKSTPNTITSRTRFITELERVKKQGFAEDNEEREMYLFCLSVPIFDAGNRVIAAISISVPTMRYDLSKKEFLLKELRKCGEQISEKLGNLDYQVALEAKISEAKLPKRKQKNKEGN